MSLMQSVPSVARVAALPLRPRRSAPSAFRRLRWLLAALAWRALRARGPRQRSAPGRELPRAPELSGPVSRDHRIYWYL